MVPASPSLLDRLVGTLQAARAALVSNQVPEGAAALGEAFGLLGALYAMLDSGEHPELSDFLQSVYERCLVRIGEAGPGRHDGLEQAILLLRQVRAAQLEARRSPREETMAAQGL